MNNAIIVPASLLPLLLVFVIARAVAEPQGDSTTPRPLNPALSGVNTHAKTSISDCDNLLAFRLSLMEGTQRGPLANCSVASFAESPPLSAFDCVGMTANACAALYRTNLPQHYMTGGWNPNNELWYLPLARDVAGGNLCLDGTRQIVYADKAVAWQCSNHGGACSTDTDCGAGVCEANDVESDDWVFYTQGGSDCLTAQGCLSHYMAGAVTTTTRGAPFSDDGIGILSDDSRNPFHGHNRVRLRKCNRDGFLGNATRPATPHEERPVVEWDHRKIELDLYFHGFREWLAAFDQLKDGYNAHREFYGSCTSDADCSAGDQCARSANGTNVFMCMQTKALPPLSHANTIVLSGWSGGGTGLSHTGDVLVEHLQTGAQPLAPGASVYLTYDAPWKPGLESDTAFLSGQRNMYLAGDVPSADMPGLLPPDADAATEHGADAEFSNRAYVHGGTSFESHEMYGMRFDESCVALHGYDDWYCHERHHVLANHVTAPAFARTAQRDAKGLDAPASSHMHSLEICKTQPSEENCYDWVDEEYRQRSFQQSSDYYDDFATLAEEGAAAPAPAVFAPDNTAHSGFEDAHEFFEVELMQCRQDGNLVRSAKLGESIAAWIATGSTIDAIERREGTFGGQGYLWVSRAACTSCPQVQSSAVFTPDNDLSEWDLSMCGY